MKQYECSMSAKKESLIKAHEASDRRLLGEVDYYEIIGVRKNGELLEDYPTDRYRTSGELYKALDGICGKTTKGNVYVADEHAESSVEGYLDLVLDDEDVWVFRIWFNLYFNDPIATAVTYLGIE